MELFQYCCNGVLLGLLAAVSVIDVKKGIIPNRLVLSVILLAVIRMSVACLAENAVALLLDGLLGLLAGGVPCALIILVTNGAMGAGDMKLYAALGLFFGCQKVFYIGVLSIMAAGAAALFLLILKKKDRKSSLVMAPFISMAAVAVMVFEPQINWFLKTFYSV
ncbi:MAG: A24 family peptidase [Clostridiales bacterium]|jgi:Flp pilus assembly protein protease CpaA|nr:A24 family peptidase [Clostridiales bacterium]